MVFDGRYFEEIRGKRLTENNLLILIIESFNLKSKVGFFKTKWLQ